MEHFMIVTLALLVGIVAWVLVSTLLAFCFMRLFVAFCRALPFILYALSALLACVSVTRVGAGIPAILPGLAACATCYGGTRILMVRRSGKVGRACLKELLREIRTGG